ncbi:hypothetical protein HYR99_09475 [Candidatus Poribacteria bacterium]|nr:hypothetical protein [Candidatus Poribacteria bacterium]
MNQMQTDRVPGSDLSVFRKFAGITEKLSYHLEEQGIEFHSFYSVVPLLTQLIGLENPLFGSGDSPFSIISILPRVKEKSLIKWNFDLSLSERRVLIDEFYEMIAPILLREEDAYSDLLIDTVHHDAFEGSPNRQDEFRRIQREKFNLLSPIVHGIKAAAHHVNFAHIAHYGYTTDLQREHGFLRGFPEERFEAWCNRSFPTVFELNFRGFKGESPTIRGWIIVSNNSTEQLLYSHKLREVKILQCARLAEKLGSQVVGMAGLVASFGKGGYLLSERFPNLNLTTGHAYTIANIFEIAKASTKRVGLSLTDVTVAITGAAGSIGSGCAKLFAQLGVPRMILIDLLWQEPLEALAKTIHQINDQIQVICTNRLGEMRHADVSVVATNSPRTIIQSEFLKPGAIVIDDSFPKNVPETITKERSDLIPLEGGIVRLPSGVDIERARNVPNVMDVPLTRMLSCREMYGCFAETLILAACKHRENYGLGPADPRLARDILAKGQGIGFSLAPLQFFGQAWREERFHRAVQARRQAR